MAEKRREKVEKGLLSHRTLGDYQLGEAIGKGSSGDVYKALNRSSGDIVAVKQIAVDSLSKDSLEAVMSEIELMKKLDHPNIVCYHDFVRSADSLAIVLEYVEGGALSGVVKKFGSLPESLLKIYTRQILAGLAYLHKEGVIHRDIKGANILVTKGGQVKLADFGVASRLGKNTDMAEDVPTNVAGTPYWMAPEIVELSGVTCACDIWSLGCTIIELMTGFPPYFDLQPMSALFRIVQDDHPPFPPVQDMSPQLEDFLLQCFQKEPTLRVSAQQLLKHPWLRGNSEQSSKIPLKDKRQQRLKKNLERKETEIKMAIASGRGTTESTEETDDPSFVKPLNPKQSLKQKKEKEKEKEKKPATKLSALFIFPTDDEDDEDNDNNENDEEKQKKREIIKQQAQEQQEQLQSQQKQEQQQKQQQQQQQ